MNSILAGLGPARSSYASSAEGCMGTTMVDGKRAAQTVVPGFRWEKVDS